MMRKETQMNYEVKLDRKDSHSKWIILDGKKIGTAERISWGWKFQIETSEEPEVEGVAKSLNDVKRQVRTSVEWADADEFEMNF